MLFQFLLATCLVIQACWATPLTPRITGGNDATPGQFPYQVSVQWGIPPFVQYRHVCGGSLITDNYVLTAGHCVLKIGKLKVAVGKHYLATVENTEQDVEVSQTIVHSGYKGGVAQHDIALLKLKTPLTLNKRVAPLELPVQDQVQTGYVVLSGWGSVSRSILPVLPKVLQTATLPLLENDECLAQLQSVKSIGKKPQLFPTQVCTGAGEKSNLSACSGDSGGPLVQYIDSKPVQVGIVSWGILPCGHGMPSVYTRVASYADWINKHVKENLDADQTINMMKLIVFVALFVAVYAEKPYLGFNLPLFEPRITGGSNANQNEFPYQVSLQWGLTSSKLKHFCGGSILNERWILTAGHCVLAVPSIGSFVVKAGKHNIANTESGEQQRLVIKQIVHENYRGGVNPYDIALLKLNAPLNLNSIVSPIKLPKSGSIPSGNSILSGWGSVSTSSIAQMPDILQKATLPLIDINTCRQALNNVVGTTPIHETNVCTGPLTGGYSACSGDSGGPLAIKSGSNSEIIGVVSWGIIPCGTRGAPSVYTRVSAFNSWIENKINKIPQRSLMLAQRPIRIVGGKDSEKGLYPWQLSIHWGDPLRKLPPRHICGGSLLTAGWVLTAGHCKTLAPKRGEFLILAGKHKLGVLEDTEQSRKVIETFVYPLYNGSVAPYDIALMKLESPFELNPFVSTVLLPYPETIPEGEAIITGWGSISRTKLPKNPEILQSAMLPILDYDLCKRTLDKSLRHEGRNPLHSTNICTGPLDGSLSACKGDSGGPLVSLNAFGQAEIIGIVSWGLFPCGGKNAPSVYTRVSSYITWITWLMLNH
ncbi:PREDICTED: transmembrane protease serine 9-like [Polistes dominula]|uniref:Transmembrane protease serine 9-like n=1 Tax=Polistes dominula TaxID=743375 RepID=A0ABM1I7Q9_POLDO|nr:PREDICTED: transmembrane protease serine 9-like [Polistes dominula]